MLDIDDFVKRIELLLARHGLTAASFADKIGVQRSSISHLFSGRNKPSLDFILKIVNAFPETDLYWLMTGVAREERGDSSENGLPQHRQDGIEKIVVFYTDGTFSEHRPK